MESIRVILAGGSPLLRTGIAATLAQNARLQLVAEARDAAEAAVLSQQLGCDVFMLNASIPHVEVGMLAQQLADPAILSKVLVLTENASRDELLLTLRMGVNGYGIRSHLWPEDLCAAAQAVARGDAWACSIATRLLMLTAAEQATMEALQVQRKVPLSERELEVLRLAAAGDGENDIAAKLYLSRNTVKTYLRRIREKLQAASRSQAVSLAIQRGLLPDRRELIAS